MEVGNPEQQYSVKVADTPIDRDRLRAQLEELGLRRGMTVLVHCSMSRIGWVDGGAGTLREALRDVLGRYRGTVVVPTQTRSKSATSTEYQKATEGFGYEELKLHDKILPGFNARRSPAEDMGVFAEAVRTHPWARRSPHPTTSFAAVGRRAGRLCAEHPLDCLLGPRSPLGRLAELDARVLLLGVGFDKCTAFHLGEDRCFDEKRPYRCKIEDSWIEFNGFPHRDDDFTELGRRFLAAHSDAVRQSPVGEAPSSLFPLNLAADFAEKELPELRFAR